MLVLKAVVVLGTCFLSCLVIFGNMLVLKAVAELETSFLSLSGVIENISLKLLRYWQLSLGHLLKATCLLLQVYWFCKIFVLVIG